MDWKGKKVKIFLDGMAASVKREEGKCTRMVNGSFTVLACSIRALPSRVGLPITAPYLTRYRRNRDVESCSSLSRVLGTDIAFLESVDSWPLVKIFFTFQSNTL